MIEQITNFEKNLKHDEEIGVYLASFSKEMLLSIENISYQNPYFIIFDGILSDGSKSKLVTHVSKINVLFVAIKIKEGKKPRRIGIV